MPITYQPLIAPWPAKYDNKLPVSEMFYSIQGEGRYAGTPALFIRLNYCNLGCTWCDTRYTWDKDKIEPDKLLEPQEITERALALLDTKKIAPAQVHVVITGGEPMLHQNRIPQMIDKLRDAGFSFFELETNGMFVPSLEMTTRITQWNCSPKLRNNGLSIEQNRVPDAIRAIARTERADFKFVVKAEADVQEIIDAYLPFIGDRSMVMLMAEGTTARKQLELMPMITGLCMQHGFRFSPRLHVLIWGNERGR